MKEALSSFDLLSVTRELQSIVGGHVDKIYHPNRERIVFSIRTPGESKRYLHFHVGQWLYLSDKGIENPGQPSDFAMMLRKRITNAKISDIRQQGFERIVVMTLEKEERFELIFELFAEGNVILVRDGVIVQPLTSHTWKHRDVRARKEFVFPPPVPNPFELDSARLLELLRTSDSDIVRTLATKLNMGGRYSEEICARAGIDRLKKAADIDTLETQKMLDTISRFRDAIVSSARGYVVTKGSQAEDVVPIMLETYKGSDIEEFESFSKAIEEYVPRVRKPAKEAPKDFEKELGKLSRKIAQQEAAIMSLQDQGRESQIAGDALYAKYAEVERVLSVAKAAQRDREALAKIPGFFSFDQKNSLLQVLIDGSRFTLDINGTVDSSAQRYYEEAKKSRRKLEGALAALEEARKETKARDSKTKAREQDDKRIRAKPTKRFWFERFRWFISSEGAVVLGGKDAKSNDILVKKHLEAGDRYAHADMHGAPSVVVKMRDGITEKTLNEACEFAIATSKAWNAKIGSAAGYWVLPEQVSKTPQSGEYLAKGAFVIRGKRNYSNKLDIRLAIGEIEFERERKIMAGPVEALKSRSNHYVVLRPGERDKDLLARLLSEEFEVPIEEVQSVMPPGDAEILDQKGLRKNLTFSK
jgi:predicted ribosome quality control (RQC) complex YloA/Tae2 family protein